MIEVARRIAAGASGGARYVLGLPAGRTPQSTIDDLAAMRLDLSGTEIVMMDEFVGADLCGRFGRAVGQRLGVHAVHVPSDPDAYEALIDDLGGIDLFVLASGASDGHVAFNQPGTPLDSRTRVVLLAEPLRRDNLRTFPELGSIDDVPTHGITIGLGTIVDASRSAVLLLLGPEKATSARRVQATTTFDPDWPATVIHACRNGEVIVA